VISGGDPLQQGRILDVVTDALPFLVVPDNRPGHHRFGVD
jgi:hypothetical protein